MAASSSALGRCRSRTAAPQHAGSRRPRVVVTAAAARQAQRGTQRLFLDSADLQQWRKWAPTGTLYGFTTNPLILDRDGVPCTIAAVKQLLAAVRSVAPASSSSRDCAPNRHAQPALQDWTTHTPHLLALLLQARGLGVSELQCQAWGGSADALEASAFSLLELDPDFITVSA
jgi:hypothetical protein